MRVPRHKERVYSISVNGSPIAAGNEEVIINIPSSNGEVSERSVAGLRRLDPAGKYFYSSNIFKEIYPNVKKSSFYNQIFVMELEQLICM